jgi:prolyl-tRNA editing enzyme YbaK/EbsC (Cys-tRNA(Pro) deacylase)
MRILKFKDSVATSEQAAKVLGVSTNLIIKTLIFNDRDVYFVAILQGSAKIDYQKLKKILDIRRPTLASAGKVKEISGSSIGGVMPIFKTKLTVILDKNIQDFDKVYGGGGDEYSLCEVTPNEIITRMNPLICSIIK